MGKAINNYKIARRLKSAAGLLVGNLLLAFSVNCFFIPNNIMSGGATGVSLILYRFFNINTSITVFIINGILLIVGTFTVGKNFLISTAISSLLPIVPPGIDDFTVKIMCGGFLSGLGIGLVIRAGGSTGGSDELAIILNKLTSYPVANIMSAADTAILLSALFFSEIRFVIYSIIAMIIEIFTISRVTVAGTSKIQLFVVSRKNDEIRKMLLERADAGLTMIDAHGGYLGTATGAILCIIPRRKLYHIEEEIYKIDEDTFITVTEIKEVRGNGFSRERNKSVN